MPDQKNYPGISINTWTPAFPISQQVHWYLQLVVPEAGDSLFLLTAIDFTTKFPVQLED